VDDAGLARVRAPIGLDLGARTPEETAISICAEIIACQTGTDTVSSLSRGTAHPPQCPALMRTAAVVLAAGAGPVSLRPRTSCSLTSGAAPRDVGSRTRASGRTRRDACRDRRRRSGVGDSRGLGRYATTAGEGQATSLQAGIAWAEEAGFDAVVVGLGDQPLIPPEAWRTVAASSSPIAVAVFDGQRRPPTRLAAAVWPLLPRQGDEGARVVMAQHPELVEAVACLGQPIDIDTLEDLAQWS